jgi:hypothetical protein
MFSYKQHIIGNIPQSSRSQRRDRKRKRDDELKISIITSLAYVDQLDIQDTRAEEMIDNTIEAHRQTTVTDSFIANESAIEVI